MNSGSEMKTFFYQFIHRNQWRAVCVYKVLLNGEIWMSSMCFSLLFYGWFQRIHHFRNEMNFATNISPIQIDGLSDRKLQYCIWPCTERECFPSKLKCVFPHCPSIIFAIADRFFHLNSFKVMKMLNLNIKPLKHCVKYKSDHLIK